MTSDEPIIRYRRALAAFVSVLLFFLVAADFVLVAYERDFIYKRQEEHSRDDAALVGKFIAESLLKHDYATVESLIAHWGRERHDISKIRVSLPRGFVITEYVRPEPTDHPLRLSRDFYYTKDRYVTLEVVKDLTPVEEMLSWLNRRVLGVSFGFALALGVFLWIVLKRTAMAPLEREISQRKKAEAAVARSYDYIKTVIDSINESIMVIDTQTFRIVGANRCFLSEHAFEETGIRGRTCHEVRYGLPTPCAATGKTCPVTEVLATGEPLVIAQSHTAPDGTRRYTEVSVSPIRNEWGEIRRVVHVARDITDRRHAEELLAEQSRALVKSNTELQHFAYIASHDLQEPLRKVIAFGDRLRDRCGGLLDEQGADYLARMQNAAQRMQVLINDLLTLSRVTSKGQPFAPVDLQRTVREVVSDLEIKIEETGGEVVVGTLPVIEADPLQMRQLFQNLIANALKFHRNGIPPRVEIGCEGDAEGGESGFVRVICADNGIGFEEKYSGRIFEVFQRLHGRKEYEGTGIGLAVCRKIVERHSGSISATSVPGAGTRFIVDLPPRRSKGEKVYGAAAA